MFGGGQAFVATQGFASAGATPAASDGKKKPRQEDKQCCLPVTIRAIENALSQRTASGEVEFYGHEQGILVLVATAENVAKQGNAVELSLNDATGRIRARHFTNDASQKAVDELVPGRYVNVFGCVRTSPEVHFAVTGLRLVSSADEVSFHMIEAAHAALKLQNVGAKAQGIGVTIPEPIKASTPTKLSAGTDLQDNINPSSDMTTPIKLELRAPVLPVPNAGAKSAHLEGDSLKHAVLDVLRREGEGTAAGLTLENVHKFVSTSSYKEVREILMKLVDEGDLFNTIDDDHFQVL